MIAVRKTQSTRLQPDESWMTTEDAAESLCISPHSLLKAPCNKIKRRCRSTQGNSSVGSGYLWNRREVEYIAALRCGARISMNAAMRVFVSVRDESLKLESIRS